MDSFTERAKRFRIAQLTGDGVGTDIMHQGLRLALPVVVLQTCAFCSAAMRSSSGGWVANS